MLKGLIQQMLDHPECGIKCDGPDQVAKSDDSMIKYWFPMLFSFFDIIMNGEDLEVRRM
jgi:brefeldin A-inhibited guanine nucleotide-exchange protein